MSEEIFQTPQERTPQEAGANSSSTETPASVSDTVSQGPQVSRVWPVRGIAVGVGFVLALGLGGFLLWQTWFPSVSKRLADGEVHWRAGYLARQQGDWDKAIARFRKAVASSEEIIQYLGRLQGPSGHVGSPEQDHWLGLAHWLRARAIFGAVASQLEKEASEKRTSPPSGLPKAEVTDVLELFLIPHEPDRSEALQSLYSASIYLPENVTVLREALKHRMNEPFEYWDWQHIKQLADNIFKTGTRDAPLLGRAYYVLALMAYHQPDLTKRPAKPRPSENKDPSSMLEALQWLERLEAVEQPLRFRAIYLRAQIWHWLANPPPRKSLDKPEQRKAYQLQLEHLLFDPQNGLPGALGRQAEQQLEKLSSMDVEGVFGLYRLAIEQLSKAGSLPQEAAPGRKQQLVGSALRLAQQAGNLPEARAVVAWRVIRESVQLLRSLRSEASQPWWQEAAQQVNDSAEKLVERFPQADASDYADLAELNLALTRAVSASNPAQQCQGRQRTKNWIERARGVSEKERRDQDLRTRLDRIQRELNRLP